MQGTNRYLHDGGSADRQRCFGVYPDGACAHAHTAPPVLPQISCLLHGAGQLDSLPRRNVAPRARHVRGFAAEVQTDVAVAEQRGRARVLEKFSLDAEANRIAEVYRTLV